MKEGKKERACFFNKPSERQAPRKTKKTIILSVANESNK